MKASGTMASPRARGHFTMRMVMSTKASGKIASVTAMGFMSTRKAQGMKESGRMIHSGDEESRRGMRAQDMRACMCLAKSRAMASISGPMGLLMLASGLIIRLMARDSTIGQMEGSIGDIGGRMICMGLAFTYTPMGLGMKASFKMIRRQVLGFITGKMEENMKGIGIKGSNMD